MKEYLTEHLSRGFIIGKLIWLCVTRSDIAIAVNKIATFTASAD
jgi:hypothetical protein